MRATTNIYGWSRGVARGEGDVIGPNILHNVTTAGSSRAPSVFVPLLRQLGLTISF